MALASDARRGRDFRLRNYNWQTRNARISILVRVPDRAAQLQRKFGTAVRCERVARGLTQQELAFEAQLSLTYVGEIERGQRMVSLDTVVRVATALKLTPAELLSKAEIG
jgi:ribosome-binding protein aMBF1 (putative translation factor)